MGKTLLLAGESNISDNLYQDENDIDEVSTPMNTPSSENGHSFGIIAPEIIQSSSFIYSHNAISDVSLTYILI